MLHTRGRCLSGEQRMPDVAFLRFALRCAWNFRFVQYWRQHSNNPRASGSIGMGAPTSIRAQFMQPCVYLLLSMLHPVYHGRLHAVATTSQEHKLFGPCGQHAHRRWTMQGRMRLRFASADALDHVAYAATNHRPQMPCGR